MSLSSIALLHPDGVAARVRVIGGNCPARLRPRPEQLGHTPVDLLVLAPTRRECQRTGWLRSAADELQHHLAVDGIVYVFAPVGWRARIGRLLSQRGLRLEPPMLHLPNWAAGHYLVPLTSAPATYMFAQVLPNPRWKRSLALGALRVIGAATLVGRWWPSVAFAARRPSERPLLDWLFRLDGDPSTRRCAAISASWRAERGSAVVHRFSGAAEPSAVAKVSADSESDEAAALTHLAPLAAAAGVQVPTLLASGCLGNHRSVVLESLVRGQSVAGLLSRSPDHLGWVVTSLTNWLERWNQATRRYWPAHEALERFLLDSAGRLLPDRAAYRAWLAARCARVEQRVPLVAAHNDLTTWNLLLNDDGRLGVVDWEVAELESLPFTDFFYAITDAVALAGRLERPAALRAWVTPGGPHASLVKPSLRRLAETLSLPRDLLDLCLHACFIGHALNERSAARPGAPEPFGQIVDWLACNREAMRDWISA